jgi:hypothetical protein
MSNVNSDLGNRENLVTKSSLVFRGELQEINDPNTMASLIKNNNNKKIVLAKVKDIIYAPQNIQVGSHIILQLDDRDVQTGRQMIFFAMPQLYGETIVAKEAGRTDSENEASVRKQVDDTIQQLADKDLINKINQSAIVLLGEISDVHEIDKSEYESQKESSELDNVDDPVYGEATINVFEVLKGGSLELSDNKILFNTNTDHVLEQKPNYKPGDQGIFFLQENKTTGADRIKYSSLEKEDFKPVNPGERNTIVSKVKSLIKSSGSLPQKARRNVK